MAGCSGRMSRRTRTRRQPLRRRPRGKTTGRGRARAGSERREGTPRTGPGANRSATRQPRTQRGDHSQRTSPPPPPYRPPCSLSGSRGAASPHPLPIFFTRFRNARQRTQAPTPPPLPPKWHRPREGRPQRHHSHLQSRSVHPRGGGGGTGGQLAGNPARGGGGRGAAANPTAAPRPRASGRCKPGRQGSPPQASPRGDGGRGPARARRPFALGFTRSTTVMPLGDEGTGREPTPPRGTETLAKVHGRANNEDTLALGAGPSLAPCALRVRLGGRHGGSARSCSCADPCTHSVQDLNRLIYFRNFWTRGL